MAYVPIYDPMKSKSLERNRCFLCGCKLTKLNRTDEHIFPKWLLNRYKLWNHMLTLLNGKSIQYRKIKISCCKDCNNVHLGKLERPIERASKHGYNKFCKLPKEKIFLWLQKIFYQILYMELRLLFDLKDDKKGTIIDRETIERYRMCHLFLQATRLKVKFNKPLPWSIFVFRVQEYDKKELNFDFKDNILFLTIALRMNDIGIIACLQDNNFQEQSFGSYFRKIKKISLHPIQFNELIAQVFYKESLRNRIPKYIVHLGKDHLEVISMPLAGMSSKPIYDKWIPAEYARWLSNYCNLDYNHIYKPPDKVWTILFDEKLRLRKMNIKDTALNFED